MWFRMEGTVEDFEASLAGLVDLPLSIANDPMSDATWLKIDENKGETDKADATDLVTRLSVVPGRRFHVDENGNLTQAGHRLSSGKLPANLNWIPLANALRLEWPTAALAGRWTDPPTQLRLVRGGSILEPSGIMVTLEHLRSWVDTAPAFAFVACNGFTTVRLHWSPDIPCRRSKASLLSSNKTSGPPWDGPGNRRSHLNR